MVHDGCMLSAAVSLSYSMIWMTSEVHHLHLLMLGVSMASIHTEQLGEWTV